MNVIRAAAAVYVAVYHIAQSRDWLHGPLQLLRFGQEAVIVFFVLSGVVIYANEQHRSHDLGAYLARRVQRLYPCLLAAILVSIAVAADNGSLRGEYSWIELAGTLVSLQDINALHPGALTEPFLKNAPLWTLSYEIAFYGLFPLLMALVARRWRRLTVTAVSISAYALYCIEPHHSLLVVAYFAIWWTGADIAMSYGRKEFERRAMLPACVCLAVLTGISIAVTIARGDYTFYRYPILHIRHFAFPIVLCLIWQGALGRWFSALAFRIRAEAGWVSSISYGIYIFHYPLTVISRRAYTMPGLVVMMALTVLLSIIFDRQLTMMLVRWRSLPAPAEAAPAEAAS